MNNLVNFPKQLPTMHQLELPRAAVAEVMSEIEKELMSLHQELYTADPRAFAALIHKISDALQRHADGMKALSDTVRKWSV